MRTIANRLLTAREDDSIARLSVVFNAETMQYVATLLDPTGSDLDGSWASLDAHYPNTQILDVYNVSQDTFNEIVRCARNSGSLVEA